MPKFRPASMHSRIVESLSVTQTVAQFAPAFAAASNSVRPASSVFVSAIR